jgi:4a-hydroxytetrahydrobiopterin dehydratase
MAGAPLQALDEAAIRALLVGQLDQWSYDGRFLVRRYRTGGWKSTLMVVNAIGHLAEAAWHHPEITATYPAVDVRLETHDAGGITERDLELAARIEALVTWRPDATSALEGTPSDPQHRHVLPDA